MPPARPPAPQATADSVARTFFGIEADPGSRSRALRRFLLGALEAAILVPGLFWLRFGEVGPLGWGATVFFVAYCLVAAIALYFRPRTSYHTPVPLRGDWLDKIGAFWLIACVFGPFFGWVIAAIGPITPDSWRGVYGARVFLAAGLPLLTALPMMRYVRGKAALIALPLLIGLTLLPIWTVVDAGRDLLAGPIERLTPDGQIEVYLAHTQHSLNSGR